MLQTVTYSWKEYSPHQHWSCCFSCCVFISHHHSHLLPLESAQLPVHTSSVSPHLHIITFSLLMILSPISLYVLLQLFGFLKYFEVYLMSLLSGSNFNTQTSQEKQVLVSNCFVHYSVQFIYIVQIHKKYCLRDSLCRNVHMHYKMPISKVI